MPNRKRNPATEDVPGGRWNNPLFSPGYIVQKEVAPADLQDLERIISQYPTQCRSPHGHMLWMAIDNRNGYCLQVSDQAHAWLGLEPARLLHQPLAAPPGLLLPAEVRYLEEAKEDMRQVLALLPPEDRASCQVQWNLELHPGAGKTWHVVQEWQFPLWTEEGQPLISVMALHELGPMLRNDLRTCRIHIYREGKRQLVFEKQYVMQAGNGIPLSRRELDILESFANGLNSREVAERLYVSVNTVKTHRKNILRKLAVNTTPESIKIAMRNQWI